ncbi:hypothetical protein HYALB_00012531 [Hymenoscyphus albidus]|uniref:Uncharacterized protein n=1 Tax=Hymenoscyphus albidus TaxID=595503 RepID=A0A9N9LM42_9HELO|nr:hypothetical protein HYALB_00012531 [Hymenoscyphus albidus]
MFFGFAVDFGLAFAVGACYWTNVIVLTCFSSGRSLHYFILAGAGVTGNLPSNDKEIAPRSTTYKEAELREAEAAYSSAALLKCLFTEYANQRRSIGRNFLANMLQLAPSATFQAVHLPNERARDSSPGAVWTFSNVWGI